MFKRNVGIVLICVIVISLIVIILYKGGLFSNRYEATETGDGNETETVTNGSESYDASFTISKATQISDILSNNASEEYYGGTYYSDNAAIVILLCEDSKENEQAIQQLLEGKMMIDNWDEIQFKECLYSLSYLTEIYTLLNEYFEDQVDDIILSEKHNCVCVVIKELNEEIEEEILSLLEDNIPEFSKEDTSVVFSNEGWSG